MPCNLLVHCLLSFPQQKGKDLGKKKCLKHVKNKKIKLDFAKERIEKKANCKLTRTENRKALCFWQILER